MVIRRARVWFLVILCAAALRSAAYDVHVHAHINCPVPHLNGGHVSKVGVFVCAACLAAYVFMRLGTWLLEKSDEMAVDHARSTCRAAAARYANVTAIVDAAYPPSPNRDGYIHEVNERVLYDIAMARYHGVDIKTSVLDMRAELSALNVQLSIVQNCIYDVGVDLADRQELMPKYERMKEVEWQLETTIATLHFAHDYLEHHISYFVLFETEDMLSSRYERELNILETADDDMDYAREAIGQSVALWCTNHYKPYPYGWYLSRLERDLQSLRVAIDGLAYEYSKRRSVASNLNDRLEIIKEVLDGSPTYGQELHTGEYVTAAGIPPRTQKIHENRDDFIHIDAYV